MRWSTFKWKTWKLHDLLFEHFSSKTRRISELHPTWPRDRCTHLPIRMRPYTACVITMTSSWEQEGENSSCPQYSEKKQLTTLKSLLNSLKIPDLNQFLTTDIGKYFIHKEALKYHKKCDKNTWKCWKIQWFHSEVGHCCWLFTMLIYSDSNGVSQRQLIDLHKQMSRVAATAQQHICSATREEQHTNTVPTHQHTFLSNTLHQQHSIIPNV